MDLNFLTTYREEGLVGKLVSLLPHHLHRRGARGEVGVCTVYFLTTYREEWLVGKLVCLYFPTTYTEERLVGKLVNFRLLTPPATM